MAIRYLSGIDVDSNTLFVDDANNRVGIGTTSPLKKLVVTTGNNTNSSSNKSDALAYFGGGNDNPNAQNISFPNPSITDDSIPGMAWWSADVMFGRYKNEAFWSIKETHGGALGSSQRDIIRSYFYDSGGYNYIDKTVIPNGNLSIGTTANPGSRTNIYISEAGALPNAILRLQNTGSQYLAKMILTDGNTNDAVIGYQGGVTGATQYLGFGLGTAITQMVLNGSGNVGIGTTAPQLVGAAWTTLEVQGQSAGGGGIVYTANNGATVKSHFYTDGTSGFVGTQTNHYFGFTTNNQERGRFTAGGNLLIGTTTDAGHLLYVNGTSRFNGVIHGAARLMVGITSDQTYASIFVGGDITTGGSQYALLLDPQLSGTNNYGLSANARIKASHAATNAYGVYIVNNELLSGASIVNNYGLYIANQTSGSSVNYALYSAGGTSYFAGNVGIGTGSPDAIFHVAKAVSSGVGGQIVIDNPSSSAVGNTAELSFLTDAGASGAGTRNAKILAVNVNAGNGAAELQFHTWNGAAELKRMNIASNGVITFGAYGSGNVTGTAAYALSVDSSGNVIESASPLNATSLYDLLPAGRVAYSWVGQVVNDAWTTVFTKNDNILTTGTWMVKMYVNDFSVGGGHYAYVYSGVMTWEQGTVNQTGEAAFSEVYLHRMGHAANASILYLRTAESGAAGGNIGYFQIKGNYSNTANQTIQFQFVKIF